MFIVIILSSGIYSALRQAITRDDDDDDDDLQYLCCSDGQLQQQASEIE